MFNLNIQDGMSSIPEVANRMRANGFNIRSNDLKAVYANDYDKQRLNRYSSDIEHPITGDKLHPVKCYKGFGPGNCCYAEYVDDKDNHYFYEDKGYKDIEQQQNEDKLLKTREDFFEIVNKYKEKQEHKQEYDEFGVKRISPLNYILNNKNEIKR